MTLKKLNFRRIAIYLMIVFAVITIIVQPTLQNITAKTILAYIFQLSLVALVVLLVSKPISNWIKEIGYTKKNLAVISAVVLGITAVISVFILYHFAQENTIKIYDFSQFWIKTIDGRHAIAQSIPDYLSYFLDTMSAEYTDLAAFPLMPLSYLFGTGFGSYVLSIFIIYYIPTCFLLTIFALRIVRMIKNVNPGNISFIASFTIMVLSASFTWPLMNGYVDVSGALIVAFMLNLTLLWDPGKYSIKYNIVLAFLSVVLILTRRWYAYFIVAFYFAFGVMLLIRLITKKQDFFKGIIWFILNLLTIMIISCLLIYTINPDIFRAFLMTDYSNIYSAYRHLGPLENIKVYSYNVGVLWIIFAAQGLIFLFINKQTRLLGGRLLITLIVPAILFLLVQTIDNHHAYLLSPLVLVFMVIGVIMLFQYTIKIKPASILTGVGVLCLINYIFCYVPSTEKLAENISPLTTTLRSYPEKNKYYDETIAMVKDIQNKIGDSNKKLYVIGDTEEISPEILQKSMLPEKIDAAPFAVTNSIVDLRDGFPSQLFFCDYILVNSSYVSSVQEIQQVNYQVFDMVHNDPQFAKYYTPDTTYDMGDREITLYKKIQQVDDSCVDILKKRLEDYYPDQPFVYDPVYGIALFDPIDNTEFSFYLRERSISMNKEEENDIKLNYKLGSRFKEFNFNMTCWTEGLQVVVENQNGIIYQQPLRVEDNAEYNIDVSGSQYINVRFVEQDGMAPVQTQLQYSPMGLIK